MDTGRSRQLLFTGAAALGGLLLFAYAIHSVGLPIIIDGVRRVGSGLWLILALAGLVILLASCNRYITTYEAANGKAKCGRMLR